MRQRSLVRYLATYTGQFLLTLVILNIFAWGFARFAPDMVTPAIALPALLVVLPPLMAGGVFRRIEDRRPAADEVIALSVLFALAGLGILAAVTWLVRSYGPSPLPELPAGLTETTVAAIAAGALLAGSLIFLPLGSRRARPKRA